MRRAACATAAALWLASPAWADCTVAADPDAAVRPISAQDSAGAEIVLSMSLLPRFLHFGYADAARKPACDLGRFTAGSAEYELYGDDKGERHRTALPARKGDPIATILPVVNVMQALKASQRGKPAETIGYMLATVTKAAFTGWRLYTGVPAQDVLEHDMAEVLAGGVAPIFTNGADGKTSILVPKG